MSLEETLSFQSEMSLKAASLGSSENDREAPYPRAPDAGANSCFSGRPAGLDFKAPARDQAYDWIAQALRQLGYSRLAKPDKGVLVQYLCKVTGFYRQ